MKESNSNGHVSAAAIDTGVIIKYLTLNKDDPDDKEQALILEEKILESTDYQVLYISAMTRTELLYVMCRQSTWEEAKEIVELITSNFIVLREPQLEELAAEIKCKCTISLADCYTLAIGKMLQIPVYFIREKEITDQIQDIIKDYFSINLILLE